MCGNDRIIDGMDKHRSGLGADRHDSTFIWRGLIL